jgi:predicted RNA binding protein YcfA (HicA-like mRNA interferase family)
MTSAARRQKLLDRIKEKRCKSVSFKDLSTLVEAYGCIHIRTRGSHHIYEHPALERPIVLQKPHGTDVPSQFCRQILGYIQKIIEYDEGGY